MISFSSNFLERFVYSLARKLRYHCWKDYLKQKHIVLNEDEVLFICLTFFARIFFQDFHMKNESKIFLGSSKKSLNEKRTVCPTVLNFLEKPLFSTALHFSGKSTNFRKIQTKQSIVHNFFHTRKVSHNNQKGGE